MKAIIPAVTVLAFVSCTTAGQRRPIEPLLVTSESIANQPAGQSYIITPRSRAVYDVAPGIDYSRVRVGTSTGDLTLDEFVGRLGVRFAGEELLLGSLHDLAAVLAAVLPPDDGSSFKYDCDRASKTCTCIGRRSCGDLSRSGLCRPDPYDASCGKGHGGGSGLGCVCQTK